MTAARSWSGRRGWTAAAVAAAALLVAAAVVADILGREPHGPVSSSYATDSEGVAAWATLLGRDGHRVVQLRVPLGEARLDPRSTVVVLEPEALLRREGRRLMSFVRAGGRLVIGGSEPRRFLGALLASPPAWAAGSPRRIRSASGRDQLLAGVGEVATAGEGEWLGGERAYRALLPTDHGGALLLEQAVGRGELLLLADASSLQNRLLASADNAQLALNLAGPRGVPAVFVESVHGFGVSRGLAALPGRWWLLLAGLLLAGAVWALGRARRLGPPEPEGGPGGLAPAPARSDYVEALSLLLRRAGRPEELAAVRARLADGGDARRLHERR